MQFRILITLAFAAFVQISAADRLSSEGSAARTKYNECLERSGALYSTYSNALGGCKAICHGILDVGLANYVVSCETWIVSWCQKKTCSVESGCKGKTGCSADTEITTKICNGRRILSDKPCPSPGTNPPKPSPSRGPSPAAKEQSEKKADSAGGKTKSQSDPAATTPQDRNQAQQQASQDLQACGQLQTKAKNSCSGSQSSANQPAPPAQNGTAEQNRASMQAYCQQLNQAGGGNMNANQNAGANCYSGYSSCTGTCGEMADKYNQLLSNCSGCDSRQIYEQTLGELRNRVSTCEGYSSLLSQMGSQGLASGSSSGAAAACQEMSAAAPQNAGGAGAPGSGADAGAMNQASLDSANDPMSQACSTSPNSPACRALAYEKEQRGEASFGVDPGVGKKTKGDFDIQEPRADASGLNSDPNGFQPTGVKNGTIANNSGGGIPGGEGGAPAKLDGKNARGPSGAPGYTTDVLQGFSGAGGYSAAAIDTSTDGGAGGFGGYGQGTNRPPATDANGIDLRRFLPGADKDPNRRGVGGIDIYSGQINGQSVNIWNRITERIQEKCRLGELLGCEK